MKGILELNAAVRFVLIALFAQALAFAQVRLDAVTQPAAGFAGVTTINVTGSGFPFGSTGVTVSLASSCNGDELASAVASAIAAIDETTFRLSFLLPATAAPGDYAVSIRGATAEGAAFATETCSSLTVQTPDPFVRASNGQLTLNGAPFRFGGANHVAAMFSSRGAVDQVMKTTTENHFTVLRIWGFVDIGNSNGANSIRGKQNGIYFQYWNGSEPAYNDGADGLVNLDYAIFKAGQSGVKLILSFTNNWTDFGGMDQYVKWRGGQKHDDFYTDPVIRQWYKNYILHLLTRVNSFNGVAYKDDPAVMVWELANEPRCGGSGPSGNGYPSNSTCSPPVLTAWVSDVASYIKTVDANHLVAVGDEGFYCKPGSRDWIDNCSQGVDTIAFSQVPAIDLMGFHLYPEGWSRNTAWCRQFIDDHLNDAIHVVGKPVFMGEFGLQAGNTRNSVYKDFTDRTFALGAAGALFWELSAGLPSPSAAESTTSFSLRAGSPVLLSSGAFAQMMTANAVLPLPPVAGNQWATTASNTPVTLKPLSNDVAFAGRTVNPASIDLDPATPGQQTTVTVGGGVFAVVGQDVQFTPRATFSGTTQGIYTVEDSDRVVSNPAYLLVTVKPSETGPYVLESFETGNGGWAPISGSAGTSSGTDSFHTDGDFGLRINVTTSGWFGAAFPSAVDLTGRPSLSVDIQTTDAGGGIAIAFQSGSNFTWCQTRNPRPVLELNAVTTVILALDAANLDCGSGTPNLAQVRSVFVFLNGPGTFYVDNIVAGPKTAPVTTLIESFETGTGGWISINGKSGVVTQTAAFYTDGSSGLQVVNAASADSDWFGARLPAPLNIAGKSTIRVDFQTVDAGSSTAIAIQTGTGSTWCQTANWGSQGSGNTGTVTLNLKADCPNADLTLVRAIWVWVGGGGTFNVDNLRAQ